MGGRTSCGVAMGRGDTGQQGAGAGLLGFKLFAGVSSPAAGGGLNVGEPTGPSYVGGATGPVKKFTPSLPIRHEPSRISWPQRHELQHPAQLISPRLTLPRTKPLVLIPFPDIPSCFPFFFVCL